MFLGVANFNGQHGCLKCTTIGEYSYASHSNIFPNTICEKRTDEKFRNKCYGSHHKMDSPLLKLDIDMIEDFPVGDALHLLHLGIMKRKLFGWRDGLFRFSDTKWPAKTTQEVTKSIFSSKLPFEFKRKMRGLDELSHWKGTEFRSFLHYIGIVVLKDSLSREVYNHFLLIFVAATICSSKLYFKLLPLARHLLNQYIEMYKEIYGEQYINSNVHNLAHLVDEVERFGELESFSAYSFENMLGKIKRLIRNGNRPLAQVSKRILEGINCNVTYTNNNPTKFNQVTASKRNCGENVPKKYIPSKMIGFYSKIELSEFCLSTDAENCWFLTESEDIACLNNVIMESESKIMLCAISTKKKDNFFNVPIESKHLNIYCTKPSDHDALLFKSTLFNVSDIVCKLVRLTYKDTNVFIPLLHTIL